MMSLAKRQILAVLTCMVLLVPLQFAISASTDANAQSPATTSVAATGRHIDLGFKHVFPKPLYQKSYFTWILLGASIVVAGTIVYFTAGAGAPAAATGVGTVASTIAGGGAGSYMAGLSIVGGWFGGNAMLGAAILNGIALGLGAGGATYTTLSALGKAGVLASVTATALDGFLVFSPDEKELVYRIRVPVPDRIGSSAVRELVDDLNSTDAEVVKIANEISNVRTKGRNAKIAELDSKAHALIDKRKGLLVTAQASSERALSVGMIPEDLLVLAILSKNAGHDEVFRRLLEKIPPSQIRARGYHYYLTAVTQIENGELEASLDLLDLAWDLSPYAIEPALLLVNVLGHGQFRDNEQRIVEIKRRAEEKFDSDKYLSPYSLLALYYRLAAMYFMDGQYFAAQKYYEKAYKELPWFNRFFGSQQLSNLIRLGVANSLYGQGKRHEAAKRFDELLDRTDSDDEKLFLRSNYVPNIPKNPNPDA